VEGSIRLAVTYHSSYHPEAKSTLIMRADEIHALLSIQQAMTSRLEPSAVLEMIAEESRRLTRTEISAVYLAKEDGLEVSAVSGDIRKSLLGHTVPLQGSLAGNCFQAGQPRLLNTVEANPNSYSSVLERIWAREFVVVPLGSGGETLGAILVANRLAVSLAQADLDRLMLLAPIAAAAYENARLFVQARQVAALEERQRLSRKLQDAVTQSLFSAFLIADVLPRLMERDPQEGRLRLEELREITRVTLAELRTLLLDD
jgi:transcriptional regulator with GAF, ATPase, and Fis domain